jgi:hypothetical protein
MKIMDLQRYFRLSACHTNVICLNLVTCSIDFLKNLQDYCVIGNPKALLQNFPQSIQQHGGRAKL